MKQYLIYNIMVQILHVCIWRASVTCGITMLCIRIQQTEGQSQSLRQPDTRGYNAAPHQTNFSAGHTERAMLYHELEDGMYSVTSYFFAKVSLLHLQQGSVSLHAGGTLQCILYNTVLSCSV